MAMIYSLCDDTEFFACETRQRAASNCAAIGWNPGYVLRDMTHDAALRAAANGRTRRFENTNAVKGSLPRTMPPAAA
jgi:hypothetical protein